MNNLIRQWNGRIIRQRQDGYFSATVCREDGYVNLTALARPYNQRVANFLKTKSIRRTLQNLAKELGLEPDQLIDIRQGGIPELQGTWAHEEIALKFDRWLKKPSSVKAETKVQERLQTTLGGEREVVHPVGKIDLLTQSEIIEVKEVSVWMKGVGQLMIYGQDYPFHQKRLHVFGVVSTDKKALIENYCTCLSIEVSWEYQV